MITVFLEVFFHGSKDDVETYVLNEKKQPPLNGGCLDEKDITDG
ncbi:MAG: hypothetical protein ACPH9O_05465 [Akkermansiaceae bacterium]